MRPVASAGDAFDSERTGLDHLSFAVADPAALDAAAAALEKKGITHGEVMDLEGFGIAILSFSDPDGVLWGVRSRSLRCDELVVVNESSEDVVTLNLFERHMGCQVDRAAIRCDEAETTMMM